MEFHFLKKWKEALYYLNQMSRESANNCIQNVISSRNEYETLHIESKIVPLYFEDKTFFETSVDAYEINGSEIILSNKFQRIRAGAQTATLAIVNNKRICNLMEIVYAKTTVRDLNKCWINAPDDGAEIEESAEYILKNAAAFCAFRSHLLRHYYGDRYDLDVMTFLCIAKYCNIGLGKDVATVIAKRIFYSKK